MISFPIDVYAPHSGDECDPDKRDKLVDNVSRTTDDMVAALAGDRAMMAVGGAIVNREMGLRA